MATMRAKTAARRAPGLVKSPGRAARRGRAQKLRMKMTKRRVYVTVVTRTLALRKRLTR